MKDNIFLLVFKRLLSSVIILFLLISFIFFLIRIAPGDPSLKYISPELSPELAEKVRSSFNLDTPVYEQYFSFILNLSQGDFGISYNYKQPVWNVVWEYLPFTVMFALISFILQIGFSLVFSIVSIRRINGFTDRLLSKFFLLVFATPAFVLGIFLIYIFSFKLNIFPSDGISTIGLENSNFFSNLFDHIYHLILPIITLSLSGIAVFYKYLRDNIEKVYNEQFVLNLRAGGYDRKTIIYKHVLPNALIPLISVAGIELGILLSGALITEVIFGLPGFGRLTISAILTRDYPLIVGCTFMAGALIIFSNLFADLLKVKVDKRMIQEING